MSSALTCCLSACPCSLPVLLGHQDGQIALPLPLFFCLFLEGSLGPWWLVGLERGYLSLGFYILWPGAWSSLCVLVVMYLP